MFEGSWLQTARTAEPLKSPKLTLASTQSARLTGNDLSAALLLFAKAAPYGADRVAACEQQRHKVAGALRQLKTALDEMGSCVYGVPRGSEAHRKLVEQLNWALGRIHGLRIAMSSLEGFERTSRRACERAAKTMPFLKKEEMAEAWRDYDRLGAELDLREEEAQQHLDVLLGSSSATFLIKWFEKLTLNLSGCACSGQERSDQSILAALAALEAELTRQPISKLHLEQEEHSARHACETVQKEEISTLHTELQRFESSSADAAQQRESDATLVQRDLEQLREQHAASVVCETEQRHEIVKLHAEVQDLQLASSGASQHQEETTVVQRELEHLRHEYVAGQSSQRAEGDELSKLNQEIERLKSVDTRGEHLAEEISTAHANLEDARAELAARDSERNDRMQDFEKMRAELDGLHAVRREATSCGEEATSLREDLAHSNEELAVRHTHNLTQSEEITSLRAELERLHDQVRSASDVAQEEQSKLHLLHMAREEDRQEHQLAMAKAMQEVEGHASEAKSSAPSSSPEHQFATQENLSAPVAVDAMAMASEEPVGGVLSTSAMLGDTSLLLEESDDEMDLKKPVSERTLANALAADTSEDELLI